MPVDLEWYDEYEIGIHFIDEEHKGLLSIMRNLHDAILQSDIQEAANLTDTLIDQSLRHFAHEERYLESVGFEGLEAHKVYHHGLIKQAEEIKRICQTTSEVHSIEECIDAMETYLIDDIISGDIEFKSFLEFNGYIER